MQVGALKQHAGNERSEQERAADSEPYCSNRTSRLDRYIYLFIYYFEWKLKLQDFFLDLGTQNWGPSRFFLSCSNTYECLVVATLFIFSLQ